MSWAPYKIIICITIIFIILIGSIKMINDTEKVVLENHIESIKVEELKLLKKRKYRREIALYEESEVKIEVEDPKQEAKVKYESIDNETISKIQIQVKVENNSQEELDENDKIIMKSGQKYNKVAGITTFRGNTYRDSASYGCVDIKQRKFEIDWDISIGSIDRWSGVGWNGQPAIIEWDKEILDIMNIDQMLRRGIENSVSIYRDLAYFADNGGWLQCVDINNLEPVWIRDITDDTDSTLVLEEKNDEIYLYTVCEVDKQGTKGESYIRKIDGLSGELIWENSYTCDSKLGDNPNNGGALATPIVGKNNLEDIV